MTKLITLSMLLGIFTLIPLAHAVHIEAQNSPVLALWQHKTQMQEACAKPKKYKQPKNSYTIRQTKNGTSFTSRTKVGNTTVTQTRTAKGKHKTTRTTKNSNVTNILQY
ncbi:MAG TPA: hypothetical protein PLW01_06380 [Agitococcus sp.]|nr:hypothetical protein [Agitococcus sp.]